MLNDVLMAVALILEQVDGTTFTLVTDTVKMTMEECLKQAVLVNMDMTHPYIMSCTPIIEQATGV